MSDEPQVVRILLLPDDGSQIRIVKCHIIQERAGEDLVESGMAEFDDPIPSCSQTMVQACISG